MKVKSLRLLRANHEKEAVRGKSGRLVENTDIIFGERLEGMRMDGFAGKHVVYADEVDSTNIRACLAGEQGGAHGTLFVADRQTKGKGRRGRSWDSPDGVSIYMSLLLRPEISPKKAPMLTLVMALSVAEAVWEQTGLKAQIKWPNDIVLNRKKICGILTEMSTEADAINYVVTGVGINVNQKEFPKELQGKATSLFLEGGERYSRQELIALVMERYEKNYETFLAAGDLSGLVDTYNALLVNVGQEVRILDPKGEYEAHASGINEKGELVVFTPDGEEREIYAGEVSVRGICGYV